MSNLEGLTQNEEAFYRFRSELVAIALNANKVEENTVVTFLVEHIQALRLGMRNVKDFNRHDPRAEEAFSILSLDERISMLESILRDSAFSGNIEKTARRTAMDIQYAEDLSRSQRQVLELLADDERSFQAYSRQLLQLLPTKSEVTQIVRSLNMPQIAEGVIRRTIDLLSAINENHLLRRVIRHKSVVAVICALFFLGVFTNSEVNAQNEETSTSNENSDSESTEVVAVDIYALAGESRDSAIDQLNNFVNSEEYQHPEFLLPRSPGIDWANLPVSETISGPVLSNGTIANTELVSRAAGTEPIVRNIDNTQSTLALYGPDGREVVLTARDIYNLSTNWSHATDRNANYTTANPFGAHNEELYRHWLWHRGSDYGTNRVEGLPAFAIADMEIISVGAGFASTNENGFHNGGGLGPNAVLGAIRTPYQDSLGRQVYAFVIYGHFDEVPEYIKPGAHISAGTQIGEIGNLGHSESIHLHQEMMFATMDDFKITRDSRGESFHLQGNDILYVDVHALVNGNLEDTRIDGLNEAEVLENTFQQEIPVREIPIVVDMGNIRRIGFETWATEQGQSQVINFFEMIYPAGKLDENTYFINSQNFVPIIRFMSEYMNLAPGTGSPIHLREALMVAKMIFPTGEIVVRLSADQPWPTNATGNPYFYQLQRLALLSHTNEDQPLQEAILTFLFWEEAMVYNNFTIESAPDTSTVEGLIPMEATYSKPVDMLAREWAVSGLAPQEMYAYFSGVQTYEGTLAIFQNLVNIIREEPPTTWEELYTINNSIRHAYYVLSTYFPNGVDANNLSKDPLTRSRQLYILRLANTGNSLQDTNFSEPQVENSEPIVIAVDPLADIILEWRAEGETALDWESEILPSLSDPTYGFEYMGFVSETEGSWITPQVLAEINTNWDPSIGAVEALQGPLANTILNQNPNTRTLFIETYNQYFEELNSLGVTNIPIPNIINDSTLTDEEGRFIIMNREASLIFSQARMVAVLRTIAYIQTFGLDNETSLQPASATNHNGIILLPDSNPYRSNWRNFWYYYVNSTNARPGLPSMEELWLKFSGQDPDYAGQDIISLINSYDFNELGFAHYSFDNQGLIVDLTARIPGFNLVETASVESTDMAESGGENAEGAEIPSAQAQLYDSLIRIFAEMYPQEDMDSFLNRIENSDIFAAPEFANERALIELLFSNTEAKEIFIDYLHYAPPENGIAAYYEILGDTGTPISLLPSTALVEQLTIKGERFVEAAILALVSTSGVAENDPVRDWLQHQIPQFGKGQNSEYMNGDGVLDYHRLFNDYMNHINTFGSDPDLFVDQIVFMSDFDDVEHGFSISGWRIDETFLDFWTRAEKTEENGLLAVTEYDAQYISAYLAFGEFNGSGR